MKLQDRLPARLGRYRANFDFRRVLGMLAVMDRDDLTPEARDYIALRCVIRRPPGRPDKCAALVAEARRVLFDRPDNKPPGNKLTDFEQDADLIRAAFMQNYGINLWRDRLHWNEFRALLAGLPEGSRYSEIIGIRARPMPAPTKYNAEQRQWLARAKAECAVRLTEKEQKNSYQRGLAQMAESLLNLAKDGGKNG